MEIEISAGVSDFISSPDGVEDFLNLPQGILTSDCIKYEAYSSFCTHKFYIGIRASF